MFVSESAVVLSRTGTRLARPTADNTLLHAYGATQPCAVNNDGDIIAQYDKAANRWVLTQLSVTNGGSVGYFQCVAVSQTSDATGAYHAYAFGYGTIQFNDYPKFGVWNNALYGTYKLFNTREPFC